MDISKFQLGGEWLTLNIEGGKSLKVMVKPLSDKEQFDLASVAKKEDLNLMLDKVKTLILDWDLTEGKESLKCNKLNKEKYLPYLINMSLAKEEKDGKEEDDEKKIPGTIGVSILEFAQNFNNFIKN